MKSRETLFTDSTFKLIVPNGIANCTEEEFENIFTFKERAQAFYDELLYFYLHICLPNDSSITDKGAATLFFQQLEIFVEALIIDANASTASNPLPAPPPVYRLPPGKSRETSTATSPSIPGTPLPPLMDKRPSKPPDGTIIYSYLYNQKTKDRQMLVFEKNGSWSCLVPLVVPVAYVKTRAQIPALALNATITQIPLSDELKDTGKIFDSETSNGENFGMTNLLESLNNDPSFESLTASLLLPTNRLFNNETRRSSLNLNQNSLPPLKNSTRKVLSIKSALNVRMRTTSVSPLDHVLMMSVELENNTDAGCSFSVEEVKVDIDHGFVTRYDFESANKQSDKFPITLHPVDQVTFLYSITILEDLSLPKLSSQFCPTPQPHSRPTSRRTSVSSVFSLTSGSPIAEERQRHVSIIAKGSPILDGTKCRSIESRWNCMLDLTNLRRREDSLPLPMPINPNQKPLSQTKSGQSRGNTLFSPTVSSTSNNFKGYHSTSDSNGKIKKAANLPPIPDNNTIGNGILTGGRAPMTSRPMEMEVGDGVVVSFLVSSKVVLGKLFTIHIFFVNRSKHVRRFTVVVPNKKRPNEKAIKNIPIPPATVKLQNSADLLINGSQTNQLEPFIEEADFIRKYLEHETPDADIVCLENNVRIGPLNPSTCESVALHFIAIKEAMHVIDLVQLVDNDTGFITNLRNVLEIYVAKTVTPKKGKKILEMNGGMEVQVNG
ncbi:TRAPP trafficking subunit Trs65-domain-containing protein [Gigaspora margarita]|uniref:TRAPP trafficking subunit Trs65-domain-containing protein n=1 Tax=Gigaspora margarita TaxID=4874 RepID=A0A8H3X361_GIGMA|nr:TRAPP trafficking subunit Trs65-domain-containing protein [Gigaspora margarita]